MSTGELTGRAGRWNPPRCPPDARNGPGADAVVDVPPRGAERPGRRRRRRRAPTGCGTLRVRVDLPGVGRVPVNVARICQWTWQCAMADGHATPEGHRVLAETFATVLAIREPDGGRAAHRSG